MGSPIVYSLEIQENGKSFPAVISKTKKTVFCLDKALLEKVWEILVPVKAVIAERRIKTGGFQILSKKEIELLCLEWENNKEGTIPFMWTPGYKTLPESEVTSPFGKEYVMNMC